MLTTNAAPILTTEQVATLLVRPVFDAAVCTSVSTILSTAADTARFPVVTADPSAAWVAEGAEISPSDAVLDEIEVGVRKLAGLTIISHELAVDSSPAAAQVVGAGLARDLARKLDAAYFATATAANTPPGLGVLAGVSTVTAGASWTNVDPFVEAVAATEAVYANVDTWVANPADMTLLAKLKAGTGSQVPLLASDPTAPTGRIILGRPVVTSPAVAVGTVWGIPRAHSVVVVREGSTVETDNSVFFTSDRVAVRARLRAAFAFPHPAAVVKITRASSGS